jgi:hypothetical protein
MAAPQVAESLLKHSQGGDTGSNPVGTTTLTSKKAPGSGDSAFVVPNMVPNPASVSQERLEPRGRVAHEVRDYFLIPAEDSRVGLTHD